MKRSLLRLLACPRCGGILEHDDTTDIDTGVLVCQGCVARFPIERGIPRFPIADDPAAAPVTERTQHAYKFAWRRFAKPGHSGAWEKDSYKFIALIPPGLLGREGSVGLDAGCGGGLDLVRIARSGAEIVGLDVSAGVDEARDLCHGLDNVHLVQADLNAPPLRPGSFDFIYSFGVLHHLADTDRGFANLARLLKPGGSLVTYLYEDFGGHSSAERSLVRLTASVRRLTIGMPMRLLYAACWVATPLVWALCSVPARLLRPIAPRLAGRIPFRHTLRWNVLASDLFDRFSPPVERRYSEADVVRFYENCGLERVSVRWFRGWVSWGWKRTADP